MSEPIRNEADVLAENKELKEQLAKLTSDNQAFIALMDEATKRCDTANAKLLEMEASLSASQVSMIEKDKAFVALQVAHQALSVHSLELEKKDHDFEKAVAHRVSELGIRTQAVPVPVEPTKKELKGLARAIAAHRETK